MFSSDKSNIDAFLLCTFFGFLGLHRFYVGKYFTATLQILSFGGFFIWVLIDWVAIIIEKFSDVNGKFLSWSSDRVGEYAGFKIRLAAHIIDSFIIFTIITALNLDQLEGLTQLIIAIFYNSFLVASNLKATIGKYLAGLSVVGWQKKPLSLEHSFGRCLSYFFSYITLGLGFFMIVWSKKHQGFHDKISKTYVIYR